MQPEPETGVVPPVTAQGGNMTDRIRNFLRGDGPDGRGRRLAEVLAFDDDRIERVHDFIQWLFPAARKASRAVPGAPVLNVAEADAIRADAAALAGLRAALDRMTAFYQDTDDWLTGYDHNHLRITRIIGAVGALLGPGDTARFHAVVTQRNAEAGAPINADSLRYWQAALGTRG